MTDYYVNFAPAEAVKYDGTNARQIAMWMFPVPPNPHAPEVNVRNMVEPHIRLGQWLIRQGDRVWVQDEEPARVERWEWGASALEDLEVTQFDSEADARDPGKKWLMGMTHTAYRCPVLSNGWSGPWEVVDGE